MCLPKMDEKPSRPATSARVVHTVGAVFLAFVHSISILEGCRTDNGAAVYRIKLYMIEKCSCWYII